MIPALEAKTLHQVLRPRHLAGVRDRNSFTLVVTHIPKTGGTTLRVVLRAITARLGDRIIQAEGNIYGMLFGNGKLESLVNLKENVEKNGSDASVIIGHIPYGTCENLERPAIYGVLVRNPIDRTMSHFKHGLIRNLWSEDETLDELVGSGNFIDNLQTRIIAGHIDADSPCTGETLALAKKHLEVDYALAATVNDFGSFLAYVLTLLNGPDLIYGNCQMSSKILPEETTQRIRAEAELHNEYDQELFHWMEGRSPICSEQLIEKLVLPVTPDDVLATVPGLKINGQDWLSFPPDLKPAFVQKAKSIGLTVATSHTSNLRI
jgi:hypothetical protein